MLEEELTHLAFVVILDMLLQPSDSLFLELLSIFEKSRSLLSAIWLGLDEVPSVLGHGELSHEEALDRISKEPFLSLLTIVIHDAPYNRKV